MAIRRISNKTINNRKKPKNRKRGQLTMPSTFRILRLRLIPLVLLGIGVTFLVAASIVLWWSRDLPDPQKISARQIAQSTKIYDRTGTNLLYEIGEIKRTNVSLNQVSQNIINATIAAEDDQFFKHHGIDFFGIIRGVIIKPLSG